MIYVRKDIPRALNHKIWKWCVDTLDCNDWKTYESVNGHTFSIHFDKEEAFVWFTLRWEDTIQNQPKIPITPASSWRAWNLSLSTQKYNRQKNNLD